MTTTTRKIAKAATPKAAPTIARLASGNLLLTGLPFMVDGMGTDGAAGRSSRVMGGRGLGWTWLAEGDLKGWSHAAAPGVVAECVETLAGYGVAVLDMSGKGAAPVAPGKVTRAKAAPAAKAAPVDAFPIMTNAEVATYAEDSSLASKITAALVVDGVAPEIIAAAIAAATAKADEIAKSVSATVSAPAKSGRAKAARTVKAAPVKVAAVKAAPVAGVAVALESDGSRRVTLAGAPVGLSAKAARQSLSRAGITGVHVRKDGNTLVAYRTDGAPVAGGVDAVIIAAVAAIA